MCETLCLKDNFHFLDVGVLMMSKIFCLQLNWGYMVNKKGTRCAKRVQDVQRYNQYMQW